MTVCLDTSVVLSRLLDQFNQLADWAQWDAAYSSELTRAEFHRTMDRLRLGGALTDRERVDLQERFQTVWSALHRVAITADLLDQACGAFPTTVGSPDALHLVSACALAQAVPGGLTLLTHDRQLALAAAAVHLPV